MAYTESSSALKAPSRAPWVGHICGIIAVAFLVHLVLATAIRSLPVPVVSGWVFVLMYAGAIGLSVLAGRLASRWWYVLTVLFVLSTILLVIGEYLWESR